MDLKDVATIVVAAAALYGAVLSTFNLVVSRREKRPRLEVTFADGVEVRGGQVGGRQVFIQVANIGQRPATVNAPRLRIPNGGQILFWPSERSDTKFPCDLQEGRSCKIWEDRAEIIAALTRSGFTGKLELFAEVDDAVGHTFRSKKPIVVEVGAELPRPLNNAQKTP